MQLVVALLVVVLVVAAVAVAHLLPRNQELLLLLLLLLRDHDHGGRGSLLVLLLVLVDGHLLLHLLVAQVLVNSLLVLLGGYVRHPTVETGWYARKEEKKVFNDNSTKTFFFSLAQFPSLNTNFFC